MRQAPDGMLEAGWPFPAGRLWGCDVEDFRVAAVQMNAVKGDLEPHHPAIFSADLSVALIPVLPGTFAGN